MVCCCSFVLSFFAVVSSRSCSTASRSSFSIRLIASALAFSSRYVRSASPHILKIVCPMMLYCSVRVIFSRILDFSSSELFRNWVNCPCASMVVRQNWSKSMPTAFSSAASISLRSTGMSSTVRLRLVGSRVMLRVRRACHPATYSLPSSPMKVSSTEASVAPCRIRLRESCAEMMSRPYSFFRLLAMRRRGVTPYKARHIASNRVLLPLPVSPQMRNSRAVESGFWSKSSSAFSNEAIL